MLPAGPIRIKPPLSRGGCDQEIVAQEADLERALEAIDETDICDCGLVIEENLSKALIALFHARIKYPEAAVYPKTA